jgi:tRNA G37 N-methylase TrmD
LPVLSRHTSNVRRKRRRRHLSKHFKPRRQSKTKRYSILKIFVVEGAVVEIAIMVAVVEAAVEVNIMKKRGSQANKIAEVEDVVVGEAAGQIIQMSNVTNAASMGTTQKSANQTSSAIIAVSMGTMQRSAIPRKR